MYESGSHLSLKGSEFASQLINMYTFSLGDGAKIIIGIAALTTIFSTTLTTLDASPRVMHKSFEILTDKKYKKGYSLWLLILVTGTLGIFILFISEMGILIKIATILSFLTAPFYAIFNFKLLIGKFTPKATRPSTLLKIYSLISIIILLAFSFWYISLWSVRV